MDSQQHRMQKETLTFCHLCCGIALMPSTSRRRVASEYASSGMNTEHRTWTHAWPSVCLLARRYESGGGYISFFFGSRRIRGHRRQSGICKPDAEAAGTKAANPASD